MDKKKTEVETLKALEDKPVVLPMDENDSIRLENLLLKEAIMERDKRDAHHNYYTWLVTKYKVDEDKVVMSIDGKTKTIVLTPKK